MAHHKTPRHVAVALIYSPLRHRLLMITSRKHPHLWILPKGGVEEGESAGQAAVRESWEEAGTPKNLAPPDDVDELLTLSLEPAKSQKRGAMWHVHIISVSEDEVERITTWPERHERQRKWFTPEQALGKIREWYSDESARSEVEGETEQLDERNTSQDKAERKGKKDKKGGAMEMALKRFAEVKGWEKS